MVALLVFALIAGTLTVVSPCTLPVVPLLVGAASTDGRHRVTWLLLGFAGAFLIVTVVLASALAALGVTTDVLRTIAALGLGLAGAMLVVPWLGARWETSSSRLARLGGRVAAGDRSSGRRTALVMGAAVGLLWAPCVGPLMAAVIAAAVTGGPSPQTVAVASAYVLGAAVPLGLIAWGGQRAVSALGTPRRRATLQRSFGALMVLSAALILTGLDLPLETAASTFELPNLGVGAPVAGEAAVNATPGSVPLEDLGSAPELTGITAWINSGPLTLASLRGKVVLVHFWTFDCINCLHVQPYVKAWYAQYASAGLVVIGVHTPELSFERDLTNVRQAVAQDGVEFPVAFDPAYATWNAYRNEYWPAFYFVDRAGRIRHEHFGEGDYAASEQVIRELLAQPAG
ncbi:MAG: cytochrome c biogenesis protein DipZ [Candidatus Limnocylindrales bacterium]